MASVDTSDERAIQSLKQYFVSKNSTIFKLLGLSMEFLNANCNKKTVMFVH